MRCRGTFVVACLAVACRTGASPIATSDLLDTSPDARAAVARWREQIGGVLPSGPAEGFHVTANGLDPRLDAAGETSARLLLPAFAGEPYHLEDLASGVAVDIRLAGVRRVRARVSDGYLVYAGAAAGATVFRRPLPAGVEDHLGFDERPAAFSVVYRIALGGKVAGLRLVASTLELLDGKGTPRLRLSPPDLIGTDGKATDAALAVEGCAVDRDPAGPWGRPVTTPGAFQCTVRVGWDDARVVYPAVLATAWTTTGSMAVPRREHTAILLPTVDKMLFAGGRVSASSRAGLDSAELYDPATRCWAATGSFPGAGRWSHSATLLVTSGNAMTSGMVLIAGGLNGGASLASARLYSPATGLWTDAGTMTVPRHGHTATQLGNGKILIAGGMNGATVLETAALYDPTTAGGAWTQLAPNDQPPICPRALRRR